MLDVVVIGSDLRQSLRWISDRRAAAMIGEVWLRPQAARIAVGIQADERRLDERCDPEDHFMDSRDGRLPSAWAALIKQ